MPVSGVVVDTEGQPALGRRGHPRLRPGQRGPGATRTDGSLSTASASVVKQLRLESNDYFSPEPFDVKPGQSGVKLTVIKAYEIDGTAVDAETGQPVPIETVRLCTVRRDSDDGHVTLAG